MKLKLFIVRLFICSILIPYAALIANLLMHHHYIITAIVILAPALVYAVTLQTFRSLKHRFFDR